MLPVSVPLGNTFLIWPNHLSQPFSREAKPNHSLNEAVVILLLIMVLQIHHIAFSFLTILLVSTAFNGHVSLACSSTPHTPEEKNRPRDFREMPLLVRMNKSFLNFFPADWILVVMDGVTATKDIWGC